MASAPAPRECPFCHEPVKADAVRCMHWKRLEWVEDCKGTLLNDPWA